MAQVLCSLPGSDDPRYLNRGEPNADCGIFQVSEDLALVQSVDFFTPVVDDPFVFGEIAAANALSDIFAAGATPLTVLNLVCFPCKSLGNEVLHNILAGGHAKVEEAGASVVGGHSIEDEEPKYGLAVTGKVHPKQIISNSRALPGDKLVLTKPVGTGVITTALKGGVIQMDEVRGALEGMATLNDKAAKAMRETEVVACTDITGFGLLGHAVEMAEASEVCLCLSLQNIPLYEKAWELTDEGMVPGGSLRNKDYYRQFVEFEVDEDSRDNEINLLADAQTSGGLLISVASDRLNMLQECLQKNGVKGSVVGEVISHRNAKDGIRVKVIE